MKKKFKFKKSEKWTLGTIAFLLFGSACIVVVGVVEKWDMSWLASPTAYLIYALIGLALLYVGYILVLRRIKNDE